ncbi:valine--tRNA ligase, mitochondrial [Hypanus sabinus]|uniref:valine--tRNA ligase, mitochondrial n=1 Tax=Hypanus sabinus TaxID=79690 RepID=UPI0028C3891E|nr:valine--tRNA ligase, mitochondrial [Hypanus sabinus]
MDSWAPPPAAPATPLPVSARDMMAAPVSRCYGRAFLSQVQVPLRSRAWSNSGSPAGPASRNRVRQREEKERRLRRRAAVIEARGGAGGEQGERKWPELPVITYDIPTHPGEKKDTTAPLPDSYSPQYVEAAWYPWWEQQGFFKPESQARLSQPEEATFALCIPPPNVTGSLHLGHALTVAVQDAVVRWHRMQGRKVLWLPGCDHAGIATQVVVEKTLQRERGISRQDLSRHEFLQEVWRWKEEKGEEIYHQLRRLGSSLDWDRACFTMDPGYCEAVTEAFVRLHEAGLVYRGQGLVNWSCALNSAISDIEVESRPLRGRTPISVPGYQEQVVFGELVNFAYQTQDGGEEIVVATTRPETMLGDVAVAVHPDDQRYTHLQGKCVRHPFAHRLLPIITDPLVDPAFGTGAVKVTPAHDHADHQLAVQHRLPLLTVIQEDGTMVALSNGWLKGVKRFDARQQVVTALSERGLFRGSKDHAMVLRLCSRSRDVVEPLLKSQWYVRCRHLADSAMAAVDRGDLTFIPASLNNIWNSWLSDISDWCVSRQLWWGHQIPAYRVSLPGSHDPKDDSSELWVVGRTEDEARGKAARQLGWEESKITLTRDADVLDTWFSSALFPFAALGWPRETTDLKTFYPNSLLETGSDLIFFWVARMVMLGQWLTGQLPFPQVLFHPLVRDAHGRKMSKSLGNVIDPLDVINGTSLQRLQEKLQEGNLDPRERRIALEGQCRDFPQGIPECGSDALRFALCSHRCQGEDINVDVASFLNARRFCNKIWNAMKFTLSVLPRDFRTLPLDEVEGTAAIDRWVLGRLQRTAGVCDRGFRELDLSLVTGALHRFWLHDLSDVYLECVKPALRGEDSRSRESTLQVLHACADLSLRLLSPFMPYLTEELWQRLPGQELQAEPSVCLAPYPNPGWLPDWSCPQLESDFLLAQEVVRAVRALRADYQLTKARPDLYICCQEEEAVRLHPFLGPLQTLSRSGRAELLDPGVNPPEGCTMAVVSQFCQVHLNLQGARDPRRELEKLRVRRQRLEAELEAAVGRTQAAGYREKVPERIQLEHTQKAEAVREELQQVMEAERGLEQMLRSSS